MVSMLIIMVTIVIIPIDGRARLQFNAKVNDRTDAVVRVVTGDYEFGDADTYSYTGVNFDRAYVTTIWRTRIH